MHNFEIKSRLNKVLTKLAKKDRLMFEKVMRKIGQIATIGDIEHYKNLRYDFKESQRVHIGSFVLIFSYEDGKISFEDFKHHDDVYRR